MEITASLYHFLASLILKSLPIIHIFFIILCLSLHLMSLPLSKNKCLLMVSVQFKYLFNILKKKEDINRSLLLKSLIFTLSSLRNVDLPGNFRPNPIAFSISQSPTQKTCFNSFGSFLLAIFWTMLD